MLQMFRTEVDVPAYQSHSQDDGFHWAIATPSPVANPNSKVAARAIY